MEPSEAAEAVQDSEEMGLRLPRKQSVIWVAMKKVKTKLSLTEEGATPVDWKVIFLVFVSLVSHIALIRQATWADPEGTGRGVEIKYSTCPGASKKPKCTCP